MTSRLARRSRLEMIFTAGCHLVNIRPSNQTSLVDEKKVLGNGC